MQHISYSQVYGKYCFKSHFIIAQMAFKELKDLLDITKSIQNEMFEEKDQTKLIYLRWQLQHIEVIITTIIRFSTPSILGIFKMGDKPLNEEEYRIWLEAKKIEDRITKTLFIEKELEKDRANL